MLLLRPNLRPQSMEQLFSICDGAVIGFAAKLRDGVNDVGRVVKLGDGKDSGYKVHEDDPESMWLL